MKEFFKRIVGKKPAKVLDPNKPEERKEIIKKAVHKTVKEYGEALKLLGSE